MRKFHLEVDIENVCGAEREEQELLHGGRKKDE